MKKLKTLKFLICLLCLGSILISCKKDGTSGGNQNHLQPSDLLGKYINVNLTGSPSLIQLITFANNAGNVEATVDGAAFRRAANVSFVQSGDNDLLTLDLDNNGQVIYAFTFHKSGDGSVSLVNFVYTRVADPAVTGTATLQKSPASTFSPDNLNVVNGTKIFKFLPGGNIIIRQPGYLDSSLTYYMLGDNAGFKSAAGYIGVFIFANGVVTQVYIYKAGDTAFKIYTPI